MNCPKCGAQLRPGANYCGVCGQVVSMPPPAGTYSPPPVRTAHDIQRKSPAGTMFLVGCLVVLAGGLAVFFVALRAATTFNVKRKAPAETQRKFEKRSTGDENRNAAEDFFSFVEAKDLRGAFGLFDPTVRDRIGYKAFSASMRMVEAKLGPRQSRSLGSVGMKQFYANGKSAQFFLYTYNTRFKNGEAKENITVSRIGEKTYIYHYSINTEALKTPQFGGPAEPEGVPKLYPDEPSGTPEQQPGDKTPADIPSMHPQTSI